jgi:CheY-like chemotaxis protein
MKILIIEDDENKRQQLELFLHNLLPNCSLAIEKSYNSGLRAISGDQKNDLILLDMTMPTYDIGRDEDGGRPQHYAGRAILRQMKRNGTCVPVIVVTQFDVFGEGQERMTREELDAQLRREHSAVYLGTVYYNAAVDGWKDELRAAVLSIAHNHEGGAL